MKDHYNAVRKSDLYEHCGLSKPLLMLIAGLIIGPPKEGQEADPELPPGWCIASQDTLAAMFGCSVEEVNRQIKKFERDGWLTVKRFRDDRGYPRCHYAVTPEQLKNIKTREMKKGEDGYYIRAKRPLSTRKQESQKISQKNLIWNKHRPLDDSSRSPLTIHQEADCESIKKPLDNPSMKLLQVVVPSLGVSSSGSISNGKGKTNPTSLCSPKEGKKKPSQNPERQGTPSLPVEEKPVVKVPLPVWSPALFLNEETWDKLKKFGCPPEALVQINKLKHWSNALNNTTNVITTYETLAMKDNGTATKLYKMWMPKRVNVSVISGDDDLDFAPISQSEREALQAELALPAEVRKLTAARHWWTYSFYAEPEGEFGGHNDNYEKRQKYIQFPRGYRTWVQVSDEEVLAAYDVAMEEDRQSELEKFRKLCENSKAKGAELVKAKGGSKISYLVGLRVQNVAAKHPPCEQRHRT